MERERPSDHTYNDAVDATTSKIGNVAESALNEMGAAPSPTRTGRYRLFPSATSIASSSPSTICSSSLVDLEQRHESSVDDNHCAHSLDQ